MARTTKDFVPKTKVFDGKRYTLNWFDRFTMGSGWKREAELHARKLKSNGYFARIFQKAGIYFVYARKS